MTTITTDSSRRNAAVSPPADLNQIRSDLLRPLPRITLRLFLTLVVILVVFYWGIVGTDARPATLAEGIPNIIDFISRLLPPEFEFVQGSERAISLAPFSVREPETLPPAQRLSRARAATPEALAAVGENQKVVTLYRGSDRRFHYTPDTVTGAVEEVPFILEQGEFIYIEEASGDPFILPEGTFFADRFAVPVGQSLVGKRYLIYDGELFVGWPVIISAIVETVQIALIGTLGAIILSIPFGLFAARNISPHISVYQFTRVLLNANRAIPELVYALIMVSAVGLGPFPGVLALMIGSVGSMGKLYAESIEAIDPQQVAAVRATGASRLQVFNYSVIPQAFPNMASYSLLLFEHNVRAATILGIVGAGGVGFIIQKYIQLFQYQRLMGAVIAIVIVVTVIDRLSDRIRKRII